MQHTRMAVSVPRPEAADTGSAIERAIAQLAASPALLEAIAYFRAHEGQFARWQTELAKIPAPPFGEAARGQWLAKCFKDLGLDNIHIDETGNVCGLRSGPKKNKAKPVLAISAHIDTVFPEATPIVVRQEGTRIFGPGISDNAAGVTAMLAIAGSLRQAKIAHDTGILFIGNVGEEGEGDLRGMRHIFTSSRYKDSIGYSLILDGAGTDTIVSEALGSRRFEITVRGPGGHSWSDFGLPNPILALARSIYLFTQTQLPASPKTTFNVGVIRGGTSVNSIPESASMRVDIRSSSSTEMQRLETALRVAVAEAVKAENHISANRSDGQRQSASTDLRSLSSFIKPIGSRPAGELPPEARMLRTIRAVDKHLHNKAQVQRASTDANIPLSLGREALSIGGGGSGGGAHTLQEWFDPQGREVGLTRILLTALALTGVTSKS